MLLSSIFSIACFCFPVLCCLDGSLEWQFNCYIFNATETGFVKAETICVKKGGHLVSIHDAFMNDLIGQYAPDYFEQGSDFWIGANSLMTQNVWQWTDGSNFDFSDWNKGKPKNISDFNCAFASMNNGYWNAESCFKQKPFVCKISMDSPPTTVKKLTTTTTTLKIPTSTLSTIPGTNITTSSPFNYPLITNCSSGWTYFEQTKSFYCDSQPIYIMWHEAEEYCQNLGGHLASIHSDEEDQLLFSTRCIKGIYFSIGLYTIDKGITWQWTDNSKLDYVNWYPGNPNNNNGECVAGSSYKDYNGECRGTGWFYTIPCSSHSYFICKKTT